MKLLLLLLLAILLVSPANGQLKVYSVAGGGASLGDGGPATAGQVGSTEGIWMDGNCNLYISDGSSRIRKVENTTNIISTIAGGNGSGYTGDGGHATNAKMSSYGLYSDIAGNVYFADPNANRVRKVDAATGVITTVAGGGTLLSDGIAATNAQINAPRNIYGDQSGNIYVAELGKIRKVNTAGIITTVVGTGSCGYSGDGGPATNAQICGPHTMLFDLHGNLLFADRTNHRIRKITPAGIITTVAGTSDGISGDGGPATAAKLSGPISFVIDIFGNLVIGDNQNNLIRRVDAHTGIITTIAGTGTVAGSFAEGALATIADIHPEFMYLDLHGNIYYSCFCNKIRKITNYYPGLGASGSVCGPPNAVEDVADGTVIKATLYPNPVYDELTIKIQQQPGMPLNKQQITITNILGQTLIQLYADKETTVVNTRQLQGGIYFVKVGEVYAGRFVKR